MITILQTRDFIEGVFNSKTEAEKYYSNHPEKNSCQIIELTFQKYPFFMIEVEYGKFRYFENQHSFIAFLKEINLQDMPKGKATVFHISDDPDCNYREERRAISLTLYYIDEPFHNEKIINQDFMGCLDHTHLELTPESLEDVITTNSLLEVLGLKYIVPEELRTEEICRIAVTQSGYALEYVPEELKTEELCRIAVMKECIALEYVPETFKTEELCHIAVTGSGYALEHVPEALKTEELCLAAVQKNGAAFRYVPEELKEIVLRSQPDNQ